MGEAVATKWLLGLSTALTAKSVLDKPDMPKAKTAPAPDDPMRKRAAQRAAQRERAGQGRAGTVLTEDTKLG